MKFKKLLTVSLLVALMTGTSQSVFARYDWGAASRIADAFINQQQGQGSNEGQYLNQQASTSLPEPTIQSQGWLWTKQPENQQASTSLPEPTIQSQGWLWTKQPENQQASTSLPKRIQGTGSEVTNSSWDTSKRIANAFINQQQGQGSNEERGSISADEREYLNQQQRSTTLPVKNQQLAPVDIVFSRNRENQFEKMEAPLATVDIPTSDKEGLQLQWEREAHQILNQELTSLSPPEQVKEQLSQISNLIKKYKQLRPPSERMPFYIKYDLKKLEDRLEKAYEFEKQPSAIENVLQIKENMSKGNSFTVKNYYDLQRAHHEWLQEGKKVLALHQTPLMKDIQSQRKHIQKLLDLYYAMERIHAGVVSPLYSHLRWNYDKDYDLYAKLKQKKKWLADTQASPPGYQAAAPGHCKSSKNSCRQSKPSGNFGTSEQSGSSGKLGQSSSSGSSGGSPDDPPTPPPTWKKEPPMPPMGVMEDDELLLRYIKVVAESKSIEELEKFIEMKQKQVNDLEDRKDKLTEEEKRAKIKIEKIIENSYINLEKKKYMPTARATNRTMVRTQNEEIISVGNYQEARQKVNELLTGMSSKNSRFYKGTLEKSLGNNRYIGRESLDKQSRWRLDYDPNKHMHINVEKGTGDSRKKYAIEFPGTQLDYWYLLDKLDKEIKKEEDEPGTSGTDRNHPNWNGQGNREGKHPRRKQSVGYPNEDFTYNTSEAQVRNNQDNRGEMEYIIIKSKNDPNRGKKNYIMKQEYYNKQRNL